MYLNCGLKQFQYKGAVTLGNFSCNLSRNFVATQVARCDTGCLNHVTLGNVSQLSWKRSEVRPPLCLGIKPHVHKKSNLIGQCH